MENQHKRSSNGTLISLIAIVISLSALGVSVFEVTSLQGQQRASVWPYLEVSKSYSSEGFRVSISNKGIGPALLGDVKVFHNRSELASSDDLDAFIIETIGEDRAFSYDTYSAKDASEDVLAPGDVAVLFGVPWTENTRTFVERTGEGFRAVGCYCSVYGDCWSFETDQAPRPTKACRQTD